MKSDLYYIYIMTNEWDTVFYTGITNNLIRRVSQHKSKLIPGFTTKYHIEKLIYYEVFQDVLEAIAREKQIKKWRREKKLKLIRSKNYALADLTDDL